MSDSLRIGGDKMSNKKDIWNRVADYILDSPDSKAEIVWLLKKYFKDNNHLHETYIDVLKREVL